MHSNYPLTRPDLRIRIRHGMSQVCSKATNAVFPRTKKQEKKKVRWGLQVGSMHLNYKLRYTSRSKYLICIIAAASLRCFLEKVWKLQAYNSN